MTICASEFERRGGCRENDSEFSTSFISHHWLSPNVHVYSLTFHETGQVTRSHIRTIPKAHMGLRGAQILTGQGKNPCWTLRTFNKDSRRAMSRNKGYSKLSLIKIINKPPKDQVDPHILTACQKKVHHSSGKDSKIQHVTI